MLLAKQKRRPSRKKRVGGGGEKTSIPKGNPHIADASKLRGWDVVKQTVEVAFKCVKIKNRGVALS